MDVRLFVALCWVFPGNGQHSLAGPPSTKLGIMDASDIMLVAVNYPADDQIEAQGDLSTEIQGTDVCAVLGPGASMTFSPIITEAAYYTVILGIHETNSAVVDVKVTSTGGDSINITLNGLTTSDSKETRLGTFYFGEQTSTGTALGVRLQRISLQVRDQSAPAKIISLSYHAMGHITETITNQAFQASSNARFLTASHWTFTQGTPADPNYMYAETSKQGARVIFSALVRYSYYKVDVELAGTEGAVYSVSVRDGDGMQHTQTITTSTTDLTVVTVGTFLFRRSTAVHGAVTVQAVWIPAGGIGRVGLLTLTPTCSPTSLYTDTSTSAIYTCDAVTGWLDPVCDASWGQEEAAVACINLGFNALLAPMSGLSNGGADYGVTSVTCTGTEERLSDCTQTYEDDEVSCASSENHAAGAQCMSTTDLPAIILVGTTIGEITSPSTQFMLENKLRLMFHCTYVSMLPPAEVHLIDYPNALAVRFSVSNYSSLAEIRASAIRILNSDLADALWGTALSSVTLAPPTHDVATIPGSGEVLVSMEGGYWGGVCRNWNEGSADLVCRELGYSEAAATTTVVSSPLVSEYFLEYLACSGHEERVTDCTAGDRSFAHCLYPLEGASVDCYSTFQRTLNVGDGPHDYALYAEAVEAVLDIDGVCEVEALDSAEGDEYLVVTVHCPMLLSDWDTSSFEDSLGRNLRAEYNARKPGGDDPTLVEKYWIFMIGGGLIVLSLIMCLCKQYRRWRKSRRNRPKRSTVGAGIVRPASGENRQAQQLQMGQRPPPTTSPWGRQPGRPPQGTLGREGGMGGAGQNHGPQTGRPPMQQRPAGASPWSGQPAGQGIRGGAGLERGAFAGSKIMRPVQHSQQNGMGQSFQPRGGQE